MKLIGLIGGMSWESSLEYYRIMNETTKERLGGLNSARVLIDSINFGELEPMMSSGQWDKAAEMLIESARRLERGGADFFLIGTNTLHKVSAEVQSAVNIPLLHMADAVGLEIAAMGLTRVGLLGTKFTMDGDFLSGPLTDKYGLQVTTPSAESGQSLHDIIFQELCLGQFLDESRARVGGIIGELAAAGVEGVILGCTELPLLIKQEDSPLPLLDTTAIHARRSVELALA